MNKVILSDLNLVLFGVMMGFAGANGAFQNPVAASLSTLIICGLIYFKYLNKETSTVTEKEESMKNYQMPSAKELAEKMLNKNPQLNENFSGLGSSFMVSPFAEPMYNEQAQRIQNKIKMTSPSYKRNFKKQNLANVSLQSEQSRSDESNVVDFEVFKIKQMMRQRKTEDAG